MATLASVVIALTALLRDASEFQITDLNQEVEIYVDRILDGSAPMCTTITGTADDKEGADLWVAHTVAGSNEYLLTPVKRVDGARQWEANVTLGGDMDDGKNVDIYAFYLPSDMGEFLESLRGSGNKAGEPGYAAFSDLPPGVSGDPKDSIVRAPEDC